MLKKVKLFGFDFIQASGFAEVLEEVNHFRSTLDSDKLPLLITPNVDQVVRMNDYPELAPIKQARFILPDGKPLCWVADLKKKSLNRLSGSDFFQAYMNQKAYEGKRVLFIVPNEEVYHYFTQRSIPVSVQIAPQLPKQNLAEHSKALQLADEVLKHEPFDHLVIGLGFPKQEQLAMLIIKKCQEHRLKPPLIMLLGASFEFYAGLKKRAPIWMQSIGMEWFYRMMSEPSRLVKRYAYSNTIFIYLAVKELFAK